MDDGQDYRLEEMFPDDLFEDDVENCVVGDSDCEEGVLDTQISMSSANSFKIEMSEESANALYSKAGSDKTEVVNEMLVLPSPHILKTEEEEMIREMSVPFLLDNFQVQSLVALLNNKNVVLTAPCGAGKLLVFQIGVNLLRKKNNLKNGLGICLQPLNNILFEKTNNNPPLKTAYLTMSGDAVKSENVQLSNSLDEILTGEIGCLLGHAESFLSPKGNYFN